MLSALKFVRVTCLGLVSAGCTVTAWPPHAMHMVVHAHAATRDWPWLPLAWPWLGYRWPAAWSRRCCRWSRRAKPLLLPPAPSHAGLPSRSHCRRSSCRDAAAAVASSSRLHRSAAPLRGCRSYARRLCRAHVGKPPSPCHLWHYDARATPVGRTHVLSIAPVHGAPVLIARVLPRRG